MSDIWSIELRRGHLPAFVCVKKRCTGLFLTVDVGIIMRTCLDVKECL